MLGAQEMMDYDKYLGLPMVGRKSKVSTFKELQEKITNRVIGVEGEEYIEGWARGLKKKCHSSHTNLLYELFKIPKTICDGINSALSKYWWGQTHNEKKIHWIN